MLRDGCSEYGHRRNRDVFGGGEYMFASLKISWQSLSKSSEGLKGPSQSPSFQSLGKLRFIVPNFADSSEVQMAVRSEKQIGLLFIFVFDF